MFYPALSRVIAPDIQKNMENKNKNEAIHNISEHLAESEKRNSPKALAKENKISDYLVAFSMVLSAVLIGGAIIYSTVKSTSAANPQLKNNGDTTDNSHIAQPIQKSAQCGV